jgi:Leu/Phe-tRNA-protein transferase
MIYLSSSSKCSSLIADGMVIIWAQSSTPHSAAYGSETADEHQYEKEFWKPRTTFRFDDMPDCPDFV